MSPAQLRAALAVIGRKGGKAGTGKAKTRTKRHYRKASQARWAKTQRSK